MLAVPLAAASLSFPGRASASAAALAPRTACRGQSSVSAPAAIQLRAMRCLVNWARRHEGRGALGDYAELDRSAALRAGEIRRCSDFSHTPCGEPFGSVFAAVGYLTPTASVGETLAWGQAGLGSARQAMAGWLASPEHRAILSTRRWRDLGVARVHAASLFGCPDVTVWVGQFGSRRLASPLP